MSEVVLENELELPKGWYDVELGNPNVSKIVMGQSPPSSTYNQEKNGLPFFQGTKDFGKKNPTVTVWCSKPNRIAEKGDMLFSVRAPVGTINWANEKCCIGRGLASIRPKINSEYVYYFLKLIESELILSGSGSIFNSITKDELHKRKISIAPLNEQKRIVSKIEELFSEIDSAKLSLEHTKLQLEQYRASLLKSAFEGKLTEEWRERNSEIDSDIRWNLSVKPINSKNLPKIPLQWCWRKLDQISNGVVVSFVGSTLKHYVEENQGVMFLRSQNVRKGKINFKGLKYVDKDFHKKEKKSQIKPGYLLIVRVGVNRGDSCIVPESIPIANAGNIIIARVFEDISPLLNYYFQTNFSQKQLIEMTTGSAQGVINTTSASQVLIPIPSLEEQKEIIAKIEQGFSLIENTTQIVESTLQNLQTMKMSVLKQAFEGKLVPQDPNDEPASALLEKIKHEKEQLIQKTKRKSKNVK